ncbi:hypothetical protein ACFFX0_16735 [Citricoccus parietis]|uniref:Uncharacterized protein n=1 Tax=Citricoccus parietis TaxID=592307 RepID=A0ABV5G269_9MICC
MVADVPCGGPDRGGEWTAGRRVGGRAGLTQERQGSIALVVQPVLQPVTPSGARRAGPGRQDPPAGPHRH